MDINVQTIESKHLFLQKDLLDNSILRTNKRINNKMVNNHIIIP